MKTSRLLLGSISVLLIALLALSQSGCIFAVRQGVKVGVQYEIREHYRANAEAGDADAEYHMGKSYCCGTGPEFINTITVHDTELAIDWFCKAARQQYAPAQLRLGEIYSGKVSSGVNLLQRATSIFGKKQTSMTVAWVWADLASVNGEDDGPKLMAGITDKLIPSDLTIAREQLQIWQTAPCTWKEVFPDTPSS